MTRLTICDIVHIVLSNGIVAHLTRGRLGWVLFVWAFIGFIFYVFRRITVFPLLLGFDTMRCMRYWISQQNSLRILLYITLFVEFTPREKTHPPCTIPREELSYLLILIDLFQQMQHQSQFIWSKFPKI